MRTVDEETKKYIESLEISDVPWNRLPTIYSRATDFPKYFDTLSKMDNLDDVMRDGEEIVINIEHQSTLLHATPFALIFLLRIFQKAKEQRETNDIAATLFEELIELFMYIAESINDAFKCEHAEELPHFADMLKEEYLWTEEYDEEEDELRYEENPFPDDLFYSFYYYSYMVLLECKPLIEDETSENAKKLRSWL